MNFIKKVPCRKYRHGIFEDAEDLMIEERNYPAEIGGRKINFKILPEYIEQFLYGYMFVNFMIEGREDVLSLDICADRAVAVLKNTPELPGDIDMVSACFGSPEFPGALEPLNDVFRIIPSEITENTTSFLNKGVYFPETGGTHLAALFEKNQMFAFYEDIGRHNAVDKIIGHMLLNDINPEGKSLYTTGRISSEIVKKAVRARIPAVISRSAVTCAALNAAIKYGLTLIGFSRGQRFNIYTEGRP